MTKQLPFLGVIVLSAIVAAAAQTTIPIGTIVPVELNTTIDAKKSKPGKSVTATVAQDVPLYNSSTIKAGTKVLGELLSVTPAVNSRPATIALRFNKVDVSGNATLIATNLRALASPLQVQSALSPTQIDRRSVRPWSQSNILIGGDVPGGGDVAYRETGTVERAGRTVGKSVFAGRWGVLSRVAPCPGEATPERSDRPQALWVFSHDACGVFGYDLVMTHADRPNPEGSIVLASTRGDIKLRSGSALLLRVIGSIGHPPQKEE
jgi:hypothetical protein